MAPHEASSKLCVCGSVCVSTDHSLVNPNADFQCCCHDYLWDNLGDWGSVGKRAPV